MSNLHPNNNEQHVSKRVAKNTEEISKSTEVGKEEYTPTNNCKKRKFEKSHEEPIVTDTIPAETHSPTESQQADADDDEDIIFEGVTVSN